MVNALQKNIYLSLFILIGMITSYFVFFPAINLHYYFGDAYRYVFGGLGQSCKADDGFEFMLTLGRPLQAYLDCFVYQFAYNLTRMEMVRTLAVLGMGLSLGLFAHQLFRLQFSAINAFLAAACIFLIPHLYEDTVWAGALSLPLALIFTQLAYVLWQQAEAQQNKIFFNFTRLSALFLLMIALLTYPAMAFFFITLIATKFFFISNMSWMELRKIIYREMVFFVSVCIVYFLYAYFNMKFHALTPVPEAYRVNHPNLNLMEAGNRLLFISNFFGLQWEILRLASTQIAAWLMIGILSGGLLIVTSQWIRALLRTQDQSILCKQSSEKLLVFFMLFVLSSGFFLIIPSGKPPIMLRFLFGSITFGLLTIIWSGYQLANSIAIKSNTSMLVLLSACFFVESYHANANTFVNAMASAQYMKQVAGNIKIYLQHDQSLNRIHYILTPEDYPYTKFFMSKQILNQFLLENNRLTWCSLPRDKIGREQDHQTEMLACIEKLAKDDIAITYSYTNELYISTAHMLVIDLHQVNPAYFSRENLHKYYHVALNH